LKAKIEQHEKMHDETNQRMLELSRTYGEIHNTIANHTMQTTNILNGM
jgi:hypothetical protein